jgi:hypothetical protein
VTAPEATREIRSARVQQERHRATAPASPTSRETQRIEEPRREHPTHREPSRSRAPTARGHRTAPSFGNHGHGGRGVLPAATGQPGRHFAGYVVAYQVRAIIRHPHSAVRAIEALAITVPVFLLLFAATYFMMEQSNPDNFNVDSLTRTDSLYFTVTVFATVGFGDITATSQAARVVVIAQMILDLLVLGLVVKVFLGAVQKGRGRQTTRQDSES